MEDLGEHMRLHSGQFSLLAVFLSLESEFSFYNVARVGSGHAMVVPDLQTRQFGSTNSS